MEKCEIQVLTYNIHKGFGQGKLRFLLHKMRDAIASINADLVFLQEVQGEHKRQEKRIREWPEETQFEFIADQLWPHFAYGKNAIYHSGHHGNAILSKHPFHSWENINVASTSRASRSLLHGVIELPTIKRNLHVLCIHFGLFKAERNGQLTILARRITEHVPVGEPLIIAGDFNDWNKDATDYLETDLGMQEVFKVLHGEYAKTFPALRPTLEVDRIYFRGVSLESGECLGGKPWRALSDHLPLYARFTIK
jgi:endonuclease/exonuclease/phosphatase family metal-dependent hydrolase